MRKRINLVGKVLYDEVITDEKLDYWGDIYTSNAKIYNSIPFLTFVTINMHIVQFFLGTYFGITAVGSEWSDKDIKGHARDVRKIHKEK